MLVLVRDGITSYVTAVFAVEFNNGKSRVIGFDKELKNLIVINIWNHASIDVMFVDYGHENWAIQTQKFKSYWKVRNIFSRVIKGRLNTKMIEEAKTIQSKCVLPDWNNLKTQSDVEALKITSINFHDSEVLVSETDGERFDCIIDTSWGSVIYLKCFGVLRNDLREYVSYYSSSISLDNNIVSIKFDIESNEETILAAERIEWKCFFNMGYYANSFDVDDNQKLSFKFNSREQISIQLEDLTNGYFDYLQDNMVGIKAIDFLSKKVMFLVDKNFLTINFHESGWSELNEISIVYDDFIDLLTNRNCTLKSKKAYEYGENEE